MIEWSMAKKKRKTSGSNKAKSITKRLKDHFWRNLNFYLSLGVTLLLSLGVWFYFSTPVTRFTFILPIIATWIFYLIITEIDDED